MAHYSLIDADISIVCEKCYIKGSVNGHLKIREDLNLTKIVDSVSSELENATSEAWDEVKDYVEDVAKDVGHFNFDHLPAFPTLDVDFNLNKTKGLPPVDAHFEFDNLELYMDFDVKLEAGTYYTFRLFTSETPAGFSIPGLEVGALFKASLILMTDAAVNIQSGVHLKLEDGLAMDLELFNKKVSGLTM